MAHVLVFHPDSAIRALFTQALEEEGFAVTTVGAMEDALMVLRTSLHPIVAIVEWIPRSPHPFGPFFAMVRDQPEYYGQHCYIALHVVASPIDEQVLMQALRVSVVRIPLPLEILVDLVADAARSIAGR